jgi:hypothetical protein
MEEFRPINGYEGLYEISREGVVKNLKTGKTVKTYTKKGYKKITLHKDKKCKSFFHHRVLLEAFVSKRPEGYQCNHIDGDKLNNNLSNLEWVTASENMRHAVRTGLTKRMFKWPARKLTMQDILDIRAKHKSGMKTKEILRYYKVSLSTIQRVSYGKTWNFNEEEYKKVYDH